MGIATSMNSGYRHHPLKGLHAAHRNSHDRVDMRQVKDLGGQAIFRIDHVADGDRGEPGTVLRLGVRW